jgi:hypothetical protein
MVRDFMPASGLRGKPIKDISKVIFQIGKLKCPQSYKIPVEGIRRGDWVMYLTDEQIVIVKDSLRLRAPISSINISPEFIKSGAVKFA